MEFDNPLPTAFGEPSSPPEPVGGSLAVERFRACRWRRAAENGSPECCSHRDVLPLTGTRGFDPEAWCRECRFFKLRRTPRKPDSPFTR